MLGKVVQMRPESEAVQVSKRLSKYIVENWRREEKIVPVSSKARDNRYEEFWFMASSIDKLCPRMIAIAAVDTAKGVEPVVNLIEHETLWNFDVGHAYHDMIQKRVLASIPGSVLQGSWERYGERVEGCYGPQAFKGTIERGWEPMPKYEGYPAQPWTFVEPKFRDRDYRYVGKADGILVWPDVTEILEIKTEKPEAMSSLDPMLGGQPRASHILQVQSYMWQFGLDKARIVYVEKGGRNVETSMIEHEVTRDETSIERIKALLSLCWGALLSYENNPDQPLPDRIRACERKSDARTKYCPARDVCFAKVKK